MSLSTLTLSKCDSGVVQKLLLNELELLILGIRLELSDGFEFTLLDGICSDEVVEDFLALGS